jgi:adenine phosphoribosyltransferase
MRDAEELKRYIRDVPDFPSAGVLFRDITPLLADGPAWQRAVEHVGAAVHSLGAEKVGGIEARGLIIGAAVAARLGLGFVPIRKPGKLPRTVRSVAYDLEYGRDALEVHSDAAGAGERFVIVDDVLATGGTAAAAAQLVGELGAHVSGLVVLIELRFLAGRDRLGGLPVEAVLAY